MYHWAPFVTGLIVSELPYLLVCAVLYYVCWYFTAGLPTGAEHAGSVFFVVVSIHPSHIDLCTTADSFEAHVRRPVYRHRSNDRRIYPQRGFCISCQPTNHHNSRLILWCHDTLQSD
jgi:hypothetical protein